MEERVPKIDKRKELRKKEEKEEYEKEIEQNLLGDDRYKRITEKMASIQGIGYITIAEIIGLIVKKASSIANVPTKSKMKGIFAQYRSKNGVSVYRRAAKANDEEVGWKKNYDNNDKMIVYRLGKSLIVCKNSDSYYRSKYDSYKQR